MADGRDLFHLLGSFRAMLDCYHVLVSVDGLYAFIFYYPELFQVTILKHTPIEELIKKFYEHYLVINKVHCERQELLIAKSEIQTPAKRYGEFQDQFLHRPFRSLY